MKEKESQKQNQRRKVSFLIEFSVVNDYLVLSDPRSGLFYSAGKLIHLLPHELGKSVMALMNRVLAQSSRSFSRSPSQPHFSSDTPISHSGSSGCHSTDPSQSWISIGEAASLLQVSAQTIRRMTEQGKVRCIRTGGSHRRYLREDIESFKNDLPEKSSKSNIPF